MKINIGGNTGNEKDKATKIQQRSSGSISGGFAAVAKKGTRPGAAFASCTAVTVMRQEHLVVLLDASGSMLEGMDGWDSRSKTKWDAALEATRALIRDSEQSTVQVIAYSDGHTELDMQKSNEAITALLHEDYGMFSSTYVTGGIPMTRAMLASSPAQLKRVITMTDGHFHDEDRAFTEFERLLRQASVCDFVGFGRGCDEGVLRRLAKLCNGVYKHGNDAQELVRQFKQLEAGVRGLLGSEPPKSSTIKL